MKFKALLLGDYTKAPYHPLTGVDEKLKDILDESFDILTSEDYSLLSKDLSRFQLVISYADRWDSTLKGSEAGGLVSFVARGGGLLVIHNGICLSSRHEFKSMAGASFTGHPDAQALQFEVKSEHPICKGVSNFEVHEEPYQYDFCSHLRPEVFLHYNYEGKLWESGWNLSFGEGKVICLHPGHDASVFEVPSYKEIIKRSALWCINHL